MMDNFTTLETAIKLRDAGFEPPEFRFGQLWETRDGRNRAFAGTNEFEPLIIYHASEIVFRPTATDILEQPICEGYGVSRQYDTTESGLSWVCCPTEWDAPEMVSAYHETNPAEAAAAVYLKLKK